uniref:Uncharacterized protein n=1 Tax=Avena sativa TaxID=4498 RepID=A0ACD5XA64_AVESA
MFRPKSKILSGGLPPGPAFSWPLVGNLPEMMLNKPAFRWIHLMMKEMGTDIACIRLGGVLVVPITCPKIACEVLKKQDANFASRPLTFASSAFSGGYKNAVLSPFGDQWRKMRRVLTSEIICPSRHRWLHDQRAQEADNLTRYVYTLATATSPAVDVRHVARHYCGNVIRRLVFGRRYFGEPRLDGSPGKMEVEHMDAVFTSLGLLYTFCVSDYLPCLRGLDLDGHEKMVKEANATVNRLHDTYRLLPAILLLEPELLLPAHSPALATTTQRRWLWWPRMMISCAGLRRGSGMAPSSTFTSRMVAWWYGALQDEDDEGDDQRGPHDDVDLEEDRNNNNAALGCHLAR